MITLVHARAIDLMGVREILGTGPSSARQRSAYADCGSFTQVVDSLVREWRDSVPVVAPC